MNGNGSVDSPSDGHTVLGLVVQEAGMAGVWEAVVERTWHDQGDFCGVLLAFSQRGVHVVRTQTTHCGDSSVEHACRRPGFRRRYHHLPER